MPLYAPGQNSRNEKYIQTSIASCNLHLLTKTFNRRVQEEYRKEALTWIDTARNMKSWLSTLRLEMKMCPHELERLPTLKDRKSFFHPVLQCFGDIVGPKRQSEAFVL